MRNDLTAINSTGLTHVSNLAFAFIIANSPSFTSKQFANAHYKDFVVKANGNITCNIYDPDVPTANCSYLLSRMNISIPQNSLARNQVFHFASRNKKLIVDGSRSGYMFSEGFHPELEAQINNLAMVLSMSMSLCTEVSITTRHKRSLYSFLDIDTYEHGLQLDKEIEIQGKTIKKVAGIFNTSQKQVKDLYKNELKLRKSLLTLQRLNRVSTSEIRTNSDHLDLVLSSQMLLTMENAIEIENQAILKELDRIHQGKFVSGLKVSFSTLGNTCLSSDTFFISRQGLVMTPDKFFSHPNGCQRTLVQALAHPLPKSEIFNQCSTKPCLTKKNIILDEDVLIMSNISGSLICNNSVLQISCPTLGSISFPCGDCYFSSGPLLIFPESHFMQQTKFSHLRFDFMPFGPLSTPPEFEVAHLQPVQTQRVSFFNRVISSHHQWGPYALITFLCIIFFSYLFVKSGLCKKVCTKICSKNQGFSIQIQNDLVFITSKTGDQFFPNNHANWRGELMKTHQVEAPYRPPASLIAQMELVNESPERCSKVYFENGLHRYADSNYFYLNDSLGWLQAGSDDRVFGLPLSWRRNLILNQNA